MGEAYNWVVSICLKFPFFDIVKKEKIINNGESGEVKEQGE